MKILILAVSFLAIASSVYAADCQSVAVDLAIQSAVDSEEVYRCNAAPLGVENEANGYYVILDCVAESGNREYTVRVVFDNLNTCSGAHVEG